MVRYNNDLQNFRLAIFLRKARLSLLPWAARPCDVDDFGHVVNCNCLRVDNGANYATITYQGPRTFNLTISHYTEVYLFGNF